jgi:hypothetical protein
MGGFGVMNLELFNLSLLGKWKWRLLNNTEDLVVRILSSKYTVGELLEKNISFDNLASKRVASVWWRDIQKLDQRFDVLSNWFLNGIKRKVGDGKDARFWKDVWCGQCSLKDSYQQLFSISIKQNSSIAEVVEGGEEERDCGF